MVYIVIKAGAKIIYVSLSTSWWLRANIVEMLELGPHEKAEILDADMICWDKQE